MENTNSASRILSIFKEAIEHDGNKKTLDVWVNVFEVNEPNGSKKDIEITNYLQRMHDEIESIQSEMKFDEYDEFKCKALLDSIINVLTVRSLTEPWKNVKNKLTQVSIPLCLGYCRQCLPDEENTIDPQDVEDIKKSLSELQSLLEESSLSINTRKMVQKHLNDILSALNDCKITGVSVLNSTMDTVIGEIVRKKEILKDESDKECLSKYTKILDTVGTVADKLIKSEKVVSSATKIGTQVTKALEHWNFS